MPFDLSSIKDENFVEILKKTPHLMDYMDTYTARGNPLPLFTEKLMPEHKKLKEPNLIYPISEQAFIHINPHTNSDDGYVEYVIIEPPIPERKIMEMADKLFAVQSGGMSPPVEITERYNMVENYLNSAVALQEEPVDYDTIGDEIGRAHV